MDTWARAEPVGTVAERLAGSQAVCCPCARPLPVEGKGRTGLSRLWEELEGTRGRKEAEKGTHSPATGQGPWLCHKTGLLP